MRYYLVLVPWKKINPLNSVATKSKYFYLGESLDYIEIEPNESNDFCNAKSLMNEIKHKGLQAVIDNAGSTYLNANNDRYLEILVDMNYNFIGDKTSNEWKIRKEINREIKLAKLLE